MKRLFAFIFLALVQQATFAQTTTKTQPSTTQTQGAKTLEQRADEITASMAKNLRLSPEQTIRLKAVNLSSMQLAEEAKVKYKDDPRMIVKQMDIISQTRLSQIKDLLSPYQFQQYQDRREEKMGVPNEAKTNPAARQQSPMSQQNSY